MVSPVLLTSVVLVSCADSGEIRRFALDAGSGRLAEQQVVAAGGQVMPMALSPDRRRLYVARRSAPLAAVTLDIGLDGALRVLGEAALPASMAYVACDRSGRWLLSASYGEHRVAVSPLGEGGVAAPAHQVLPVGRNAHSIVVDPSNRHAYVACLGDDALVRLGFDADAGVLAADTAAVLPMRPGAGPRHLVIAADGRCVYLLNELDATVDVLERDLPTGALQPRQTIALMPPGFVGKPWGAELRLSPDGAWLLATERRSDTLSLLAVEPGRGALSLADRVSVEAQPRGMQWSPDGQHALVAGQTSHHLASWHVDRARGRLDLCDRVAAGLNPNWIETFAVQASGA